MMSDELEELRMDKQARARIERDAKRRQRAALDLEISQLDEQVADAPVWPRWDRCYLPAEKMGGGPGWVDRPSRPPRRALLRLPDGGLFLPRGRVALLVAPGGSGKSSVLAALAASVASGRPWLDTFSVDPEACGRVLLMMGEEDDEEIERKLQPLLHELLPGAALKKARHQAEAQIDAFALHGEPCALLEDAPGAVGGRGEPQSTVFSQALRAHVEQAARSDRPYKLIVIDPLSRFAGAGDENDNNRATRLVQELETLAKASGATVVVAHHTNKGALNAQSGTTQGASRGASALVDGARWVASLEPQNAPDGLMGAPDGSEGWGGSRMLLRLVKSNYGRRDVAPLDLFWLNGKTGFAPSNPTHLARWKQATEDLKRTSRADDSKPKTAPVSALEL